jgi:hypothetical protein
LAHAIRANFGIAQTIAQTKLLAEPAKRRLEERMLTGLVLFGDVRTRELGTERLKVAAGAASILSQLGRVQLDDSARSQLAVALRTAIGYLDDTLYESRGVRLLTDLERLTRLILKLRRNYDDVNVDKPFDDPFETIRGLYRAAVNVASEALAKEDVSIFDAQCKTMVRHGADLGLILSLPPVYTQLRQLAPGRSSALRQRLLTACQALARSGPDRAAAVGYLQSARAARDLTDRFRTLAYDRQLAGSMDKVLGGRLEHLRRMGKDRVDRLVDDLSRTRWQLGSPAGAGAQGEADASTRARDLSEALQRLIRLMSGAHALARLDRLEREVAQLTYWRAWPLQTDASERMIERLASSVRGAARSAKDQMPDQSTTLLTVDQYLPLAEMLVALGERYGGRLAKAPRGVLGVVARLYDDPQDPLTPTERTVMRMCFEINEAGYAQQVKLDDYARRHLVQARTLLDDALDQRR